MRYSLQSLLQILTSGFQWRPPGITRGIFLSTFLTVVYSKKQAQPIPDADTDPLVISYGNKSLHCLILSLQKKFRLYSAGRLEDFPLSVIVRFTLIKLFDDINIFQEKIFRYVDGALHVDSLQASSMVSSSWQKMIQRLPVSLVVDERNRSNKNFVCYLRETTKFLLMKCAGEKMAEYRSLLDDFRSTQTFSSP